MQLSQTGTMPPNFSTLLLICLCQETAYDLSEPESVRSDLQVDSVFIQLLRQDGLNAHILEGTLTSQEDRLEDSSRMRKAIIRAIEGCPGRRLRLDVHVRLTRRAT